MDPSSLYHSHKLQNFKILADLSLICSLHYNIQDTQDGTLRVCAKGIPGIRISSHTSSW